MKRFLKGLLALSAAVLVLSACSSTSESEKTADKDAKHIGILQYVEHPSLTASRKGFIDELKKEGYVNGKNIVIDYKNAQGDQSNLQSISEKLIRKNDLVLGIATTAAQSLASLSTDVPILFTDVTDPVSASLVKSMKHPGGSKRCCQMSKRSVSCTPRASATPRCRSIKPKSFLKKQVSKQWSRVSHPPMTCKTRQRASCLRATHSLSQRIIPLSAPSIS